MKIKEIIKDWFLNYVAANYLCPLKVRKRLYAVYGHRVSKVYAGCFMGFGKGRLIMGRNSYCNYHCFFDLGDNIIIGNNCSIAFRVTFINSTHEIGPSSNRGGGGQNCTNCY